MYINNGITILIILFFAQLEAFTGFFRKLNVNPIPDMK